MSPTVGGRMNLFVIGSFLEPGKGLKLSTEEAMQLIGTKPQLIVVDDSALSELQAKACGAVSDRIEQEEELEHLRGFDPNNEPADRMAQSHHSQLLREYMELCDGELERIFEQAHSPKDDDRFVLGNYNIDAVYAVEELLKRITGRDAIPQLKLPG